MPRPRGPGLGPPCCQGGKGKERRGGRGAGWSLRWLGPVAAWPCGGLDRVMALSCGASSQLLGSCPQNLSTTFPVPEAAGRANTAGMGGAEGTSERGRSVVQLHGGCGHPVASLVPAPRLLWTAAHCGWMGRSCPWRGTAVPRLPLPAASRGEQGSGQGLWPSWQLCGR